MAHIALLARMHWSILKERLGFIRDHPPHAITISRTLSSVSYEELQEALTGWWPRWCKPGSERLGGRQGGQAIGGEAGGSPGDGERAGPRIEDVSGPIAGSGERARTWGY